MEDFKSVIEKTLNEWVYPGSKAAAISVDIINQLADAGYCIMPIEVPNVPPCRDGEMKVM